ncbi:MAG TPA: response regulator [Nitrospirae bacterium]|nr:response regulator MprA [bacterium BMS3Abin10]GBE38783.1 response regulator MprA [bacterium BMS3Bbin08]HDH49965.1 response regulator [Nitrospirota bacterium]HDK17260.1 response regulator [Nitrospirota bacterium]HDO26053.1 response regulator [Nitrospirota bacterium]
MGKGNILLVDDEEIVLVGWREELKSAGYTVRTASNPQKAIDMVREEKPDIVFTDLAMPKMDGVEVCRQIKAIYPDTEVVFVSGHPQEIEVHLMDFVNAGGRDEYLRKPLLENELIEVTEKICRELNRAGRVSDQSRNKPIDQ